MQLEVFKKSIRITDAENALKLIIKQTNNIPIIGDVIIGKKAGYIIKDRQFNTISNSIIFIVK